MGITVFWALATVTVIVVVTLAVAAALGSRSFTVMSGSMEPRDQHGDVIVTSRIAPSQARVGQVVSFRDPSGTKKLITHRVRRIRNDGRSYRFSTKGDANNTPQSAGRFPLTGPSGASGCGSRSSATRSRRPGRRSGG